MSTSNIPDFALFASSGHIVASTGVDNFAFETAARAYTEANGIHLELVDNGPVKVARLNRGFPLGIEPYSEEAKSWAKASPIYGDQKARWHEMINSRGC